MEIIPDNIIIDKKPEGLRLVKSYRTAHLWFILPFTLFWNGIVFFMFFMNIIVDMAIPFPFSLIFLTHGSVGLYLLYYSLTMLFNKTEIALEYGSLTVKDAPLPMGNTRTLSTADIEGFYVLEKAGYNHQRRNTYEVRAKLLDGRSVKILKRIHTYQECEFIVKKFNDAIGFIDK